MKKQQEESTKMLFRNTLFPRLHDTVFNSKITIPKSSYRRKLSEMNFPESKTSV